MADTVEKADVDGCFVDEKTFRLLVERLCKLEANADHLELTTDAPSVIEHATPTAGTSLLAARSDHVHDIAYEPNPGDPVPVYSGPGDMNLIQVRRRRPMFCGYKYTFRTRLVRPASNGWSIITVPQIPGFQFPLVTSLGTYRQSGNFGGPTMADTAPFMGDEQATWADIGRIYIGPNNDWESAVTIWSNFVVEYIRT